MVAGFFVDENDLALGKRLAEVYDGPWMFAVTADRVREIDLPA